MWTIARAELKELVRLTHEVATFDATLAAKPNLKPTPEAIERRTAMQDRRLALMDKYELTGGWQSRG
jgi:hypothetical protein